MICSGCGAPLDINTANGGVIVCPYCGVQNIVNIPQQPVVAQPVAQPVVPPVAPSAATVISGESKFYNVGFSIEQFEAECQKVFDSNPLLPDDIFREIDFKEVKCYYVPTYVLSLQCKGSVSYKSGDETHYKNYDNRDRRSVLAAADGKLPIDLYEMLAAKPTLSSTMRDEMPLPNLEAEASAAGFVVVKDCAKLNKVRARFENVYNDEVLAWAKKESLNEPRLNVNYMHDPVDDINDVLEFVPYYYVEFIYKGNSYFLACNAVTGGEIIHRLPEDSERKSLLSETLPNWAAISISAIVILPPLMWLFGPLTFGTLLWLLIPAAIAIGVITFIGNMQMEEKKKIIVGEALRRRQENKNV